MGTRPDLSKGARPYRHPTDKPRNATDTMALPTRPPLVKASISQEDALRAHPEGAVSLLRFQAFDSPFVVRNRFGTVRDPAGPAQLGRASLTVYSLRRLRTVHGGAVRIPPEGGLWNGGEVWSEG